MSFSRLFKGHRAGTEGKLKNESRPGGAIAPSESPTSSNTVTATYSRNTSEKGDIASASLPPPLSVPAQLVSTDDRTETDGFDGLPQRLWSRAYDDLKDEESSLVNAYERILLRELDRPEYGDTAPNAIERDQAARHTDAPAGPSGFEKDGARSEGAAEHWQYHRFCPLSQRLSRFRDPSCAAGGSCVGWSLFCVAGMWPTEVWPRMLTPT